MIYEVYLRNTYLKKKLNSSNQIKSNQKVGDVRQLPFDFDFHDLNICVQTYSVSVLGPKQGFELALPVIVQCT